MPAATIQPVSSPCPIPSLEALQRRDETAWTEAFSQLWPVALCAARHPVAGLTEAEAEDAASEALSQLVSRAHQVGSFGQLKPLVATIAFRKAVSLARKKSASKRGSRVVSLDDDSLSPEMLLMPESASNGALTDVEAAEMVLLLQKALNELDPETQVLIEEKHVQGATYEELGAKHGLPLGTACAKVARGLKKIRQHLAAAPALAKELKAFLR